MQMQVEAERRKRAAILESEGVREADINVAEGKRQARILASEAQRMEQINHANGEAAAMLAVADARAKGLNIISKSLMLRVCVLKFMKNKKISPRLIVDNRKDKMRHHFSLPSSTFQHSENWHKQTTHSYFRRTLVI